MDNLTAAAQYTQPQGADTAWVEHVRVPALSLGTYSIRAGGTDDQTPHDQDEVYVVLRGRAGFESGGQRVEVGPGSTLFVPALEVHRFLDVTEDLTVIVVFAPPETRTPSGCPRTYSMVRGAVIRSPRPGFGLLRRFDRNRAKPGLERQSPGSVHRHPREAS